MGILSASDEGLCQAKKVGLSGRSGFSCWPKQTLNTFTIGGFFRPDIYQQPPKVLCSIYNALSILSLPSERMGSGAFVSSFCRPLPPSLFPFPPKAEKGQEWPPGVGVFPRTLPNFAHLSQDQAPSSGVGYYFASLNRPHVGLGEVQGSFQNLLIGAEKVENVGLGLPRFPPPVCLQLLT